MNVSNYLMELNEAAKSQNPTAMIEAMQKFFGSIYSTKAAEGYKLLGLYSTAQQLEVFGMDVKVLKDAIHAYIQTQYKAYGDEWQDTFDSLHELQKAELRTV